MKKNLWLLVLVIAVINLFTIDLSAQASFMRQKSGTWIAGEFNFLDLTNSMDNYSAWNAEIHLKLKTSEKLYLLAELPISYGKVESSGLFPSERSETAIGNPFVGIQVLTNTNGLTFDAGIRIPVADEDKFLAYYPSLLFDFERYAAFTPNTLGANILINYQFDIDGGFYGKLNFGPSFLIPTKEDDETEMLINYAFGLGFKNQQLNFFAGLNGLMIVTEEDLNFDERTMHQFIFGGALTIENVEPGFILRIPTDDFTVNDLIFGLNLGVRLED